MKHERRTALASRAVQIVGRLRAGRAVLRRIRNLSVYRALLGYRRPFASIAEAKAALAVDGSGGTNGHDGAHNVRHHLEISSQARPSDYAALFHLSSLLSRLGTVFDLGGSAGNLYYCYARYLTFRDDLTWTVMDLPANMAEGEQIAGERDVRALRFTGNWSEAAGADLLLVSGSLHYLETPLPQMLAELELKPAYLLINRTPLVEGSPVAAVQTASGFRLACMLYNRGDLLRELQALGYKLVDEWKCAELSMEIPGYPEYTVPAYSGAFFRRSDLPDA